MAYDFTKMRNILSEFRTYCRERAAVPDFL